MENFNHRNYFLIGFFAFIYTANGQNDKVCCVLITFGECFRNDVDVQRRSGYLSNHGRKFWLRDRVIWNVSACAPLTPR